MRSIEISPIDGSLPTPGLRGIKRAKLDFNYPLTVLVGPNGAGKSTFLCLAALAFNGDGTTREGAGPYRFPDFFYSVRTEQQATNFQISWTIQNGDQTKTTVMRRASTKKWMDYNRRHKAGVLHIGLNRIASYAESASHKRAFNSRSIPEDAMHNEWVYSSMAKIFAKQYTQSLELRMGRYAVPVLSLQDNSVYSGFNMGTGEAAVLAILAQVALMPRGSLILIEEIELAVHPSAQQKLAELLLQRALNMNLQIICTSHSRWFMDALPREARIIVQPSPEEEHICLPNITTRMAEGILTKNIVEELTVVCEDEVAKEIILRLLPADSRSRVRVVPAGAKTELVAAAYYLKKSNPKVAILIVWDGDVSSKTIRDASKKVNNGLGLQEFFQVSWCRLGDQRFMEPNFEPCQDNAPEREIATALSRDAHALASLATSLGANAQTIREWMSHAAFLTNDHHSFFREFAKSASLSEASVTQQICQQYAELLKRTDGERNPVIAKITDLLSGKKMSFELPGQAREETLAVSS